jgi:hypothetical protein
MYFFVHREIDALIGGDMTIIELDFKSIGFAFHGDGMNSIGISFTKGKQEDNTVYTGKIIVYVI